MTDKDERAEHLDKFNRACDWLFRKYKYPIPPIELSPVPFKFWIAPNGKWFVTKGRFSAGNGKPPRIYLYDDPDLIQALFHEWHHYLD